MRILRNVMARAIPNQVAKLGDHFPQVIGRKLGILANAAQGLLAVDNFLEGIAIVLVLGLELEHDVAVHLAEAPIRVPCETPVSAYLFESLDALVRQPEIEHRIHHPRHRDARPRSHRYQQWILAIAEFAAEGPFDARDAFVDTLRKSLRIFLPMIVKI